jgi:O-antigen/teichoic acid export membrane protein
MASWTTASFGFVQAVRLGTNIVLARLLSPELFGLMLIINTLRTGADLFSDVGIGQNLISNRNAERPTFYNTAWTLQLLRGLLLALMFSALSIPLADFYGAPVLALAIPAVSLSFVFMGAVSAGRYLLQKRMEVVKLSLFEILVALVSAIAHIAFAVVSPTIWALVWGGVVTSACLMVASFFLLRDIKHRIAFHRPSARQIISFGKWIFLSSIIYFLATNFDRLFVGKALPFAIVGVYAVARSLADVLSMLVANFSSVIIFPGVAASEEPRAQLKVRLRPLRLKSAIAFGIGICLFGAGAEFLVQLLYDSRYQAASEMLPVLCIGVWFSMLTSLNEAVLLGLRHPSYAAAANGLKLSCLVVALPFGVAHLGIMGAAWALALTELVRYLAILAGAKRQKMSFVRQDLGCSLIVLTVMAVSLSH